MKQQSCVIKGSSANAYIDSELKPTCPHSVVSLKSTIESEVKFLLSKFSELTEPVKVLETKNDKVDEMQDRLQQL